MVMVLREREREETRKKGYGFVVVMPEFLVVPNRSHDDLMHGGWVQKGLQHLSFSKRFIRKEKRGL